MKSKKSTYFLLVLVLAVWGAVAFKIVSHINKGIDTEGVNTVVNSTEDDPFIPDTQIVMKQNYPDPFLKGGTHIVTANSLRSNTSVNFRERIDPNYGQNTREQVVWPEIIYNGIVRNKKTNEALGLLQITASSQLMRSGQEIRGIRLLELYSDSIRISFKNQEKTIRKNQ